MKSALLIPIYKPNELVIPFLKGFKRSDFDYFLVVDDGSGESYAHIFSEIATLDNFKVVSYPENHGKGYALKKGIQTLLNLDPEISFIVTADGDGQHTYKDILNIRDESENNPGTLILGYRDFKSPDVPKRNKAGNSFSRNYLYSLTGEMLFDTQSGLRGIPSSLFEVALKTKGNRYEYEMYFLENSVPNYPYKEIPIETVYLNGNIESHFNPWRDSYLINKVYFKNIVAMFIGLLIDSIAFPIFMAFMPIEFPYISLIALILGGIAYYLTYIFFAMKDKNIRYTNLLLKVSIYLIASAIEIYSFYWLCPLLNWHPVLLKILLDILLLALYLAFSFLIKTLFRNKVYRAK